MCIMHAFMRVVFFSICSVIQGVPLANSKQKKHDHYRTLDTYAFNDHKTMFQIEMNIN